MACFECLSQNVDGAVSHLFRKNIEQPPLNSRRKMEANWPKCCFAATCLSVRREPDCMSGHEGA